MLNLTEINDIKQYFTDLVEEKVLGAKVKLAQIYGAAKRWFDFDEEAEVARKYFNDKRYFVEETFKVSDKIWIVVNTSRDNKEKWFCPVVNGKFINEMFDTIEKAIVCAVSYQLTGRTEAGFWAMKMIESVKVGD